jgi:hypothetical protein
MMSATTIVRPGRSSIKQEAVQTSHQPINLHHPTHGQQCPIGVGFRPLAGVVPDRKPLVRKASMVQGSENKVSPRGPVEGEIRQPPPQTQMQLKPRQGINCKQGRMEH